MKIIIVIMCFSMMLACSSGREGSDDRGSRRGFSHKFSSVQECQLFFDNRLVLE